MLRQEKKLHPRDFYMRKLMAFQDTEDVKIITGIRRCGKSSLLKLMVQHLRESGVDASQIVEMNFESMQFREMTVQNLYQYVKDRLPDAKRAYLFFDEIQRVDQWQDAVNSFRVDFDCDIYVTGSNAYLLSSEYATYLTGRSVEIKMLPLSFREFLDFHGYVVEERQSPAGGTRKRIRDASGEFYEPQWRDARSCRCGSGHGQGSDPVGRHLFDGGSAGYFGTGAPPQPTPAHRPGTAAQDRPLFGR